MNAKDFNDRYWKITKSGHYLRVPNPSHFKAVYAVGLNTISINEDYDYWYAIAIQLDIDKDLDRNNSRYLVFRVSEDTRYDILLGDLSLREAFDKHSDSIVYIVEQNNYSYSPYETWAFSRNDVPSIYIEVLEKEKSKGVLLYTR